MWHKYLLQNELTQAKIADNSLTCQVQFKRTLLEVALLIKRILNPEQLACIQAHLFTFKQASFPIGVAQVEIGEKSIGQISLRRLSKDLQKLRKRVVRREGYNYNWIVDELTKQDKLAAFCAPVNPQFLFPEEEAAEPLAHRSKLLSKKLS